MTLFKYDTIQQDPFTGLDALLDHFSRGFRNNLPDSFGTKQVQVNLYSTEDSYEVRAELPGFRKEEVNVEIENAVLEIRANKAADKESGQPKVALLRKITVGDDVDAEKVNARLQDGILSIHLPKREVRKPKAIKVD
jgi:HSP20 family protein